MMLCARKSSIASARSPAIAMAAHSRQSAGFAMHRLNQLSLSKSNAAFKTVKQCFDQAATEVFQGHATVQKQGSVSKGTGVQGRSDFDFIVRHTPPYEVVTQAQRMQFLQAALRRMAAAGIRQERTASSCLRGVATDVDVCFENFKGHAKTPPNNRSMATSGNGQHVVRLIKHLPVQYTNLSVPKSMYLEDLVKAVELSIPKSARQPGSQGFPVLLEATLLAISQQQHKRLLHDARLDSEQWQYVAGRVLNKYRASGQWMD